MLIDENDRFYEYVIQSYPDGSRTINALPNALPKEAKPMKHKVMRGEKITDLAERYYGRFAENASVLWWIIAEANGIKAVWRMDIDFEGQEIVIPGFSAFKLSR